MEPNSARLVVEAVLVTAAMIAAGAVGGYVFLAARRQSPSVIAQMEARIDRHRQKLDEQQSEIDELREAMTADREEMAEMKIEMAEWRAGMRMVFQQMQAAGLTPAWQPRERPPREPRRRVSSGSAVESLPAILASLFNNEELDDLAVRVGARPEDLMGETITRRANSLVLWARRYSRLDDLVRIARQLRPEGGI